MTEGTGAEGVEDRAGRLVERWGGAAVVGLVAAPGPGAGSAARSADALARASAARRRTLLVNLAGPGGGLDREMGAGEAEGLGDVGARADLREIVLRPADRPFLYLPAGRAAEGLPGDAGTVKLMGRLADRVREEGGRLLLYLPAEGLEEFPPRILDGLVRLGDVPIPGALRSVPELGGLDAGGESPGPAEAAGGTPGEGSRPTAEGEGAKTSLSGAWRRHRHASGPPWGRIALGALVVVTLLAGWWLLARRVAPPEGETDAAAEAAGEAAPGVGAPGEGAAGPSDGRGAGDGAGELPGGSTELPYSVLLASYAESSSAREQAERWSGAGEFRYFVVPTPVRGRIYHRLFAGAFPDRASAEAAMRRLVEEGRKDEARGWDVRPVPFAFRLSSGEDADGARDRVRDLRERGIPAYALPGADGGWEVYAGAYESRSAAEEMGERLREAGVEAELVRRRGVPES